VIRFVLILLFGITACQMSETTKQLSDDAFVTFSGDVDGRSFQIGESGGRMSIANTGDQYLIPSGPQLIQVYLGQSLVMEQKIYAAPGQVVEVRVR
jgi:hypothetical protein